jgi:hypothetical protein
MNINLVDLSSHLPSMARHSVEISISDVVADLRDCMVALFDIQFSLSHIKDQSATSLYMRAHTTRLLSESRQTIDMLSSQNTDSFVLNQPLDSESEKRRREMASTAYKFHGYLERLEKQTALLEDFRGPNGPGRLIHQLTSLLNDTKAFRDEVVRMGGRVEEIWKVGRSRKLRSRGVSPARASVQARTKTSSSCASVLDLCISVDKSFQRLTTPSITVFKLMQPCEPAPVEKATFRRQWNSKYAIAQSIPLSIGMTDIERRRPANESLLFSQQARYVHRRAWDGSSVDTSQAQKLSFSPPKELTMRNTVDAAQNSLAKFGTTRTAVNGALSIAERGVGKPIATQSVNTPHEIASIKPEAVLSAVSAALPPLSTKAPTAFSAQASPDSTENQMAPQTRSFDSSNRNDQGGAVPRMDLDKASSLPDSLVKTDNSKSRDSPAISRSYRELLEDFYVKYCPTKLGDIEKLLEKYKGREAEMFAKLSKKYNVANPLGSTDPPISGSFGAADRSSKNPFTQSAAQKGPSLSSVQRTSDALSLSPFRASVPGVSSHLGATGSSQDILSASSGAFGTSHPSPAGFSMTSNANHTVSSAFGSSSTATAMHSELGPVMDTTKSPFDSAGTPAFGQLISSPSTTPFGMSAQSSSAISLKSGQLFTGGNPRETLLAFYNQHNPSKVAEVDRLLAKYQGKEDQMFRNLAKKYNLDPSTFGISSGPSAALAFGSPTIGAPTNFGQPSALGGGSPFGAPVPAPGRFGGAISGGGFSQFSSPSSAPSPSGLSSSGAFGSASFGALAQSPAPSGFGAFGSASLASPFGSTTPFGAARR